MKKFLAILLVMLMMLACMPTASAAEIRYIKRNSEIYKEIGGEPYVTSRSHTIYINDSITDADGNAWYEFEFSWWDLLWYGKYIDGYKYILVENTTDKEPDDQPEVPDDEVLDVVETVTYEAKTETASVDISAVKGAFPEGTEIIVKDTTVSESEVRSAIADYCSDSVLGFFALDISFTNDAQPSSNVVLSLGFPDSVVPEGANKVIILHFGEKTEVVGSKYLYEDAESHSVSVGVSGFSSYAAVFVNGKYSSQKMSDVLKNNSRYSIAEFPVDIFNYDPVGINTALDSLAQGENAGFHFTGYGVTKWGSNSGINNSESTFAKQGILEDKLVNGLPDIKYIADKADGKDAGIETGKLLFDANTTNDAKEIYNDIPFEFIYDKNTGYYVYKSSANHAQMNTVDGKKKIELYADTLSTQNKYIEWNDGSLTYCVDANKKDYVRDFTSIDKPNTVNKNGNNVSFKATVSDSDSSDRLDPWVSFVVNNVDASTVGQIYVKANIPASVGTKEFKLYFITDEDTTWDEAKTLGKIDYTPNGDYIEFVIDTSENAKWTGTITGIRIDLFDTSNVDMITQSYTIEISQICFIQKGYNEYATRGGYYPFSEIEDSYPGNNTAFNMTSWETVINDDKPTNYTASRAIYNPSPAVTSDLYNELAYGTVMEFDFYIPVSHKVNGNDLTYYFSGDDDLWVFVDNQLVLDIGGGHGAITGSVNFTNGNWEVEKAVTVTGYNSGAVAANAAKKDDKISDELFTAGKHTMKIFYLERGGSVSNCFMKFNLPQTPTGSVEVTKEVKVVDDAGNEVASPYMGILEKEVFEFTIETQDVGANSQETSPTPYVGKCYVTSGGKTEDVDITDGKFTLKDGERASFIINENYEVTVTETTHDVYKYTHVSTTVNNNNGCSAVLTTEENKTQVFTFVNNYKEALGDLKITKSGIDDLDNHAKDGVNEEEFQSTIYTVAGADEANSNFSLTVAILGNGSVIIKDLPVGNYTVMEDTTWSWRYETVKIEDEDNAGNVVNNNNVITTAVDANGNTVKFTNTRQNDLWLSGDNHKENQFEINTVNTVQE